MKMRAAGLVLLLLFGACGERGARHVDDPIPEITSNQQRAVTRSELRYQWPFTVGAGTLGCVSNAVIFRADGVSYSLNDAAKSRGFPAVDPIWQVQGSGPPSNPLKGIVQDDRMRLFAESASCDGPNATDCKRRLRIKHALSDAEFNQIEVEGRERLWPPLTPKRISLEPLIEAGLKLCPSSARSAFSTPPVRTL